MLKPGHAIACKLLLKCFGQGPAGSVQGGWRLHEPCSVECSSHSPDTDTDQAQHSESASIRPAPCALANVVQCLQVPWFMLLDPEHSDVGIAMMPSACTGASGRPVHMHSVHNECRGCLTISDQKHRLSVLIRVQSSFYR